MSLVQVGSGMEDEVCMTINEVSPGRAKIIVVIKHTVEQGSTIVSITNRKV